MDKEKYYYLAYRPFVIAEGLIVNPKTVVQCTKLEAMCINTMQPMTLREVTNDLGQVKASYHDGNI